MKSRTHTTRQILLIRKHQQETSLHLPIVQNTLQLLPRFLHPMSLFAVDDKHETLRAGVVVPPERTEIVLSSGMPDIEFDVLILTVSTLKLVDACVSKRCMTELSKYLPVGKIATEWFRFSLYKISSLFRVHLVGITHLSFPLHPAPASTVSSLSSRKFWLR